MPDVEIRPFSDEHLDAAAALLADAVTIDWRHLP
jgi:hypothetical protein